MYLLININRKVDAKPMKKKKIAFNSNDVSDCKYFSFNRLILFIIYNNLNRSAKIENFILSI